MECEVCEERLAEIAVLIANTPIQMAVCVKCEAQLDYNGVIAEAWEMDIRSGEE